MDDEVILQTVDDVDWARSGVFLPDELIAPIKLSNVQSRLVDGMLALESVIRECEADNVPTDDLYEILDAIDRALVETL